MLWTGLNPRHHIRSLSSPGVISEIRIQSKPEHHRMCQNKKTYSPPQIKRQKYFKTNVVERNDNFYTHSKWFGLSLAFLWFWDQISGRMHKSSLSFHFISRFLSMPQNGKCSVEFGKNPGLELIFAFSILLAQLKFIKHLNALKLMNHICLLNIFYLSF